jgi:glycosyltransferase involved in cell wall biosynthesis
MNTYSAASGSTMPRISVVIPHLNQPGALDACLASLEAQSLGRDAFEILVVDNGSRTLPDEVISRHPGVRLDAEPQPGPGHARNRGVALSAAEILAFIDADCRAHPDWLRNALVALDAAPPRTILGGDVQIWRDNPAEYSALEAYEAVFAYRFKLYIEQHGFSGTGNLVVRKADFRLVGPFQGIEVAEDVEWGRRALAAGYRFRYAPELVVYHPARKSLRELFVKWDRHIQHAVNAARGHSNWRAGWLARSLAVLASPAVDWIKVAGSDRVHGVAARLKAIGVLIAVRAYRAWRMIGVMFSRGEVSWNRGAPGAE